MGVISRRVAARFLLAKSDKKRMIVMMGPPAAGKGFFLGEPEKDKDGKPAPPPKDKFGWKLPKMLVDDEGKPLLTEDDIPERPTADESDNHLRAIQFEEAKGHFDILKSAKEQGEEQFQAALADHWYDTKDGGRIDLSSVLDFKDFPGDFKSYFDKTNKDFYVSMRGWHNDASEKNESTGKPKERYKDEARHRFDDSVIKKIDNVQDMLIVDSAGEDIDVQDYKGQIEQAKAAGFEVTVIFLHPEQADTELSNVARGKVMGKRMVDQADISNWYKRNADALKDIQAANPDNFCHYRKGPPDPDPAKAAELRAKARDLMGKYKERIKGAQSEDEKKAIRKESDDIVYGTQYKLEKATSYGVSLSGQPKEPEKNIADAVDKMNKEAEARVPADAKNKTEPAEDNGEGKPAKEEPQNKPAPEGKKKEPADKTQKAFLDDMGDKKVANPNPENRDRTPQIKIRSLPWMYQKPFYDQWAARQAAVRVKSRYDRRIAMVRGKTAGTGWLARWMGELAEELGKVKVEGYEVRAEATKGPEVFVTIVDAAEDTTSARDARKQTLKIMDASIKKNTDGVEGFESQVQSFNKGGNIVLQCTIVFPRG